MVAILEAAAELFADAGHAGTTTNRIAARAGVSIGSLYQYFPNKDAILAGLMKTHHADIERVVADSLPALADPDIPFEHGFRSLLQRLVDLHTANPALMRALSREGPHLPRFKSTAEHADDADVRHFARILERRPDVRSGNALLMARIVAQSVEATARWLVHEAPSSVGRSEAIDEIVRMVTGYVSA